MNVSKFETVSVTMTTSEAFAIAQVLSVFINESKDKEDIYVKRSKELLQKLNALDVG